jgi:predicted KAP-like P-loop ATPase
MADEARADESSAPIAPARADDSLLRDDLVTDRALRDQDADRLDHGPIARRVLDLVTVSDPPVNVALFGAWGAGKSSFATLLEREIKDRELDIRIVNYNAWTFTGESLQRNFISHAAKALGVDPRSKQGRLYHQGL